MLIKEMQFNFEYQIVWVGIKRKQIRYRVGFMRDGLKRFDITAGHLLEVILRYNAGEYTGDIDKSAWNVTPDSVKLNASIKCCLGELPDELHSLTREEAVHKFCTESAGKWFIYGWHEPQDPLSWIIAKMTWKEAEIFLNKVVTWSGGKWRLNQGNKFNTLRALRASAR